MPKERKIYEDPDEVLADAEPAIWTAYAAEGHRITPFVIGVFDTWNRLYRMVLLRSVTP